MKKPAVWEVYATATGPILPREYPVEPVENITMSEHEKYLREQIAIGWWYEPMKTAIAALLDENAELRQKLEETRARLEESRRNLNTLIKTCGEPTEAQEATRQRALREAMLRRQGIAP